VKEVTNELSPEQIILFGSYATNTAQEHSDIDIAVVFDGFEGNYLKVSALLWELSFRVNTLIEPILVDKTYDPSGFVEHILKTGEVIYKQ
jgi:predicted nucleotidyltransferase